MVEHYAIDVNSPGAEALGNLVKKLADAGCREVETGVGKPRLFYCGEDSFTLITLVKDSLLIDLVNPPGRLLDEVLSALPPSQTLIRILERGFEAPSPRGP